ncbi:hypothetical protein K438DRAFT_1786179 [Mycena galopus ATCC 62051]|nr:hypothetical protein K438DRAFT_1786179 [Mycena galopus ATCC 62051]
MEERGHGSGGKHRQRHGTGEDSGLMDIVIRHGWRGLGISGEQKISHRKEKRESVDGPLSAKKEVGALGKPNRTLRQEEERRREAEELDVQGEAMEQRARWTREAALNSKRAARAVSRIDESITSREDIKRRIEGGEPRSRTAKGGQWGSERARWTREAALNSKWAARAVSRIDEVGATAGAGCGISKAVGKPNRTLRQEKNRRRGAEESGSQGRAMQQRASVMDSRSSIKQQAGSEGSEQNQQRWAQRRERDAGYPRPLRQEKNRRRGAEESGGQGRGMRQRGGGDTVGLGAMSARVAGSDKRTGQADRRGSHTKCGVLRQGRYAVGRRNPGEAGAAGGREGGRGERSGGRGAAGQVFETISGPKGAFGAPNGTGIIPAINDMLARRRQQSASTIIDELVICRDPGAAPVAGYKPKEVPRHNALRLWAGKVDSLVILGPFAELWQAISRPKPARRPAAPINPCTPSSGSEPMQKRANELHLSRSLAEAVKGDADEGSGREGSRLDAQRRVRRKEEEGKGLSIPCRQLGRYTRYAAAVHHPKTSSDQLSVGEGEVVHGCGRAPGCTQTIVEEARCCDRPELGAVAAEADVGAGALRTAAARGGWGEGSRQQYHIQSASTAHRPHEETTREMDRSSPEKRVATKRTPRMELQY